MTMNKHTQSFVLHKMNGINCVAYNCLQYTLVLSSKTQRTIVVDGICTLQANQCLNSSLFESSIFV